MTDDPHILDYRVMWLQCIWSFVMCLVFVINSVCVCVVILN